MTVPDPPPESADTFEEDRPPGRSSEFVVDLEEFEGPLDLLLTLARQQKLDIKNLSIQRLADQYLAYIAAARHLRLEVAADYLVMAAWLAYLKSRLLLPDLGSEEEADGAELAARLQHQLQRLEAMREAADSLMARDRLGLRVFRRGMPEGIRVIRSSVYECSLFDLLSAYGNQIGRNNVTEFRLRPVNLLAIDDALKRLARLIGEVPDWASLETFLPAEFTSGLERRSAMASTMAGALELARQGRLQVRQGRTFGPIFIKGQDGA